MHKRNNIYSYIRVYYMYDTILFYAIIYFFIKFTQVIISTLQKNTITETTIRDIGLYTAYTIHTHTYTKYIKYYA